VVYHSHVLISLPKNSVVQTELFISTFICMLKATESSIAMVMGKDLTR
jgi:hypothetical protein